MLAPDDLVGGRTPVVHGGGRALVGRVEPLGELPAGRDPEVSALGGQAVVQDRAADVAAGPGLPGRPDRVAEEHAELLDGAFLPELARGLVGGGAVDGDRGRVHRRHPVDDPVRHHVADAAAGQDAERVQPGRDPVAVQLGRRAQQRPDVGGERLRPAEERPHPGIGQRRDPLHRLGQERLHPLPVRRQLAEREVARHAVQRPRRADRLEQADQHPVALGPVVAVALRVLDHRQVLSPGPRPCR